RISTARSTIQRTKSSSLNSSRPSRITKCSHHPTKTHSIESAAPLRRLGDRRIVQAGSGPDRHPVSDDARRDPGAFLDHAVPRHDAVKNLRGRADDASFEDDAVADDRLAFKARGLVQTRIVHNASRPEDRAGSDVTGSANRDTLVDSSGVVQDHGSFAL